MRLIYVGIAAVAMVSTASALCPVVFRWTGNGTTAAWNDGGNWQAIGAPAFNYPSQIEDAVEFPSGSAATVNLTSSSVANCELRIERSTTFVDPSVTLRTVQVSKVLIVGGATAATEVKAQDSRIKT